MVSLEKLVIWIILTLSSISTILVITEAFGFLPDKWSLWLNRKKLTQTLEVLKQLGIDVDKYKRAAISSRIPSYYNQENLINTVVDKLKVTKIETVDITVGKTDSAYTRCWYDVMGFTTDSQTSVLYARFLSTYLQYLIRDGNSFRSPSFDFIVTPKQGSPILGYEFAKIVNKPFILHPGESKFNTDEGIIQKDFDVGKTLPSKGSTALLVDDSTTGGRKMKNAINDLRKHGFIVTDCLVMFEPTIKNARRILEQDGVVLHSIVKIDNTGEIKNER